MLAAIWLALGLFATAWTFLWVVGRDRIYIKAAVSMSSWAIVAMTGGRVHVVTDAGEEVSVAAPSLQYLAAGMAVLSFFILLLYRFDEYPPRREGAA